MPLLKQLQYLYSDYCFKTRKHCLKQGVSILACNIVAVLLIRLWRTMDIFKATTFCVTYSCATARDLHTVPFSFRLKTWKPLCGK